jgi:hypothetical protein
MSSMWLPGIVVNLNAMWKLWLFRQCCNYDSAFISTGWETAQLLLYLLKRKMRISS